MTLLKAYRLKAVGLDPADGAKYEVILYWSQEDGVYVAEVPQLSGCSAHGASQEEALCNAQDAIDL